MNTILIGITIFNLHPYILKTGFRGFRKLLECMSSSHYSTCPSHSAVIHHHHPSSLIIVKTFCRRVYDARTSQSVGQRLSQTNLLSMFGNTRVSKVDKENGQQGGI